MNEKEVTFNVKYEIVLYTPVFNARCPPPPPPPLNNVIKNCGFGNRRAPLNTYLILILAQFT